MNLYEALAANVAGWRTQRYPHDQYPAVAEILEWAAQPETADFRLRPAQLRALETYWYLRLVAGTPHIIDLYQRLFTKTTDRLAALGMGDSELSSIVMDDGYATLLERVRTDDDLARRHRLETLRESLLLGYPSYILALAMGAGKTVLIGAIIASEFAMAQEYPDGRFIQNALVFAPGKTIIEALRELASMRFEAVLPPRMYRPFAAGLKLTFTRDGEMTIPVVPGSAYNVIVTNTEKIRIQKENIRRSDLGPLFAAGREDEARAEVANLRLQAIASLPNLGIFSDEAHHTYGQALDRDLKKVRKTVDYLHNPHPAGSPQRSAHHSNLIAVVNTTGTPYYQHQPLRDVVIWYGLAEGIRDGILKEVSGNIKAYDFAGNVDAYVGEVIRDFFSHYGDVTLPDGTPAKLAMFFPQTDDLIALRPTIETAMLALGYDPTQIVEHHTRHDESEAFNRFSRSPQRVALLVDRGVEGWNVPALFGTALARKLKNSNNFVLQAASRCLRQVPGNQAKASIYLSTENRRILDAQLAETYGETIATLDGAQTRSRRDTIVWRKLDIPPLVVRRVVRYVVPTVAALQPLRLTRPTGGETERLSVAQYEFGTAPGTRSVMHQIRDGQTVEVAAHTVDLYTAAHDLAARYYLPPLDILAELRRLYPGETALPERHLAELAGQIETQTSRYEAREETVETALALVRKEGFRREEQPDGTTAYVAEIQYPVDREALLLRWSEWQAQAGGFGFHYDPYNTDSHPEVSFLRLALEALRQQPDEIEDIYFTGALTSPQKTDFLVEYRGQDGRWHTYTPDFLVRRKDGRCLIVEIKSAAERDDALDGENGAKAVATRAWAALNPDRLHYEMIFATDAELAYDQIAPVREFANEN